MTIVEKFETILEMYVYEIYKIFLIIFRKYHK